MSVREAKVVKKRQHSRVNAAWPVFAESDRRIISGKAINISPGGAFILFQNPLKLGEVFELTVSVPLRNYPIRAIAEVVRSQTAGFDVEIKQYGIGVQFIIIPDADRESISSFVSDRLKSKVIYLRMEKPSHK